MASFNWVHISDLHIGMSGQATLWPMFKHQLYSDLQKMYDRTGPWEAVLFTGDLTQKGSPEAFAQLNRALEELWIKFAELGCSPVLVPIPGNHDLKRPDRKAPTTLLLKQWWNTDEVREAFWDKTSNLYRTSVNNMFSNYTRWLDTLEGSIRTPRSLRSSLVPGDFSTSIETAIGKVGLVGLNSAWLQLDDADYEGGLAVDTRQLHAVTNSDPVSWCQQNQFNIILTHHPISWLHPHSQSAWQSEINPSGALFDIHMFGHMHDQDATSVSHGGGGVVRSIQAASIFGLEKYGNKVDRRHGYSIGRINGETGEIRIWPRRAELAKDGSRRLVPDHSQILDDDESFCLLANRPAGIGHNAFISSAKPTTALLKSGADAKQILEKARYLFARSLASRNVRNVEQTLCRSALSADHVCWIDAEWGTGFEGFISTLSDSEISLYTTYRLDFSEYSTKEEFFAYIRSTFNVSFESLCDALSAVGPAHLIFEDIPPLSNCRWQRCQHCT